ncbi:3-oxoacyl-ACP synthase [Nocardia asteroides NBRC 15531]|uniref:3-oxoacyl-[acyl-carrier-protein] synthase II n=2 Tax=Nocardia asteroides TaxID=1824 RepID=U5EJ60_NOCAS|nr:beta-ketoacyl synthase N-terminal-like domain-containing protein [Nocardia asteroides]TLF62840.1 3-oxoacyl-ACP synthase [Nocardia asteroides NBRC 15531]UGT46500.1 3-oxoacyl-ACP synthase [Nocardia asteroides]SFN54794.1 3-oxoacyl-[acyl-carrier-protein] synthase II [Nocardia asteroides]VEG34671.1 3-oxoacyl-[acyl-carrier-protein] synthase 2 [Nocardia asteroides]GAD85149.1 3-oxoacyl-[acyl-carrier-protein] synthase II [Nocardia asteroides NBRC 15531]
MSIAGIGVVSGYGWGREHLWKGVLGSKPAARLYPGYGPDRDQHAWIARIPDDGDLAHGGGLFGRAVHAAAAEAIADAEARGWCRAGRTVGLVHAFTLGDVADWRDFYLVDEGHRRSRDYLRLLPSTPISVVMQEFGFHGPAMNVSAACSSGSVGLLTAKMWRDAGLVDDVLCVTTDISATPEMVEHFVRLGAAVADADPLTACKPFQEGTLGFPMAEASVAFLLTDAVEQSYARVLGGAMTNDAFHVVSVDPAHTQIIACARRALTAAGVDAADIAYVNAHATGTVQCDTAERDVLTTVFADRPVITALKPLTGHCQGAAAAVEVATIALSYERGIAVSAPIVAPAHPRLLDGTAPMTDGLTLKLSMGMGGNNAAVVLGPA